MKYKAVIEDRSYSTYYYVDADTNARVDIAVDPVKHKLFSKDIFELPEGSPKGAEGGTPSVYYSHVRSGTHLAGVLMLEHGRTFGRTPNKKKLYYKCVPDDKHLPAFVVPYDPQLGFAKTVKNKFVVFKFDAWTDAYPTGALVEVVGDVDQLSNFYEYQLYCKSLHHSIAAMTENSNKWLKSAENAGYVQQITQNPRFCIRDDRGPSDRFIFTIDPKGSKDMDDAFSIHTAGEETIVTIYIANVLVWIETMDLWDSFSNRVSTIYLPDRRRPMLPTILSDTLCSLQANADRFAFTLELAFVGVECVRYEFSNRLIRVGANFAYEDPELLYRTPDYTRLAALSRQLDETVENSHDVVSFWMIYMNRLAGEHMAERKIGVYRSAVFTAPKREVEDDVSKETLRVIQTWGSVSGQYVVYDADRSMDHELLQIKSYAHVTSPIRRLVDLLNQIWITGYELGESGRRFFDKWIHNMDYLNTSMRSIRKIQIDCEVLARCHADPAIVERVHRGILFDKIQKNDGAYLYMVYLEELRLLTRMVTHESYENCSAHDFKVYLFDDEDRVRRKIRIQKVSP
jgi:exoribonuclease R